MIGSALASSLCYEVHWQTGATKFIMFGSCGSLDADATKGRYIIPSALTDSKRSLERSKLLT